MFRASGPHAMALALSCAALPACAQQPPVTVSTVAARTEAWQDHVEAVGSLRAAKGADLASEVSGVVDWIGFDSGAEVAANTVLLRLRPNDDAAKLQELQASADLAATNLGRDQKQLRAQAVSQASIDADDSKLRVARAQVAQLQALMAEKVVRAPFAGRLGLRQVDVGQYLPAGTMVVTLQALDTLYADFYVPQQSLAGLHQGESVSVRVDAYPGRVFTGVLTAISPKLDPASRMAQVRATVANGDHALLPGMFATVSVDAGAVHRYVTLPNAAVVFNTYGSTVYVVGHDSPPTVRQVLVKTGPVRGDQVAVLDGLRDGETVVSAGQLKLHQGAVITVNNAIQPSSDPAPNPPEE